MGGEREHPLFSCKIVPRSKPHHLARMPSVTLLEPLAPYFIPIIALISP